MSDDGEGVLEVSDGKVGLSSPCYTRQILRYRLQLMVLPIFSNLMAPDDMKNLGFPEGGRVEAMGNHAGGATAHKVRDDGKKIS